MVPKLYKLQVTPVNTMGVKPFYNPSYWNWAQTQDILSHENMHP